VGKLTRKSENIGGENLEGKSKERCHRIIICRKCSAGKGEVEKNIERVRVQHKGAIREGKGEGSGDTCGGGRKGGLSLEYTKGGRGLRD